MTFNLYYFKFNFRMNSTFHFKGFKTLEFWLKSRPTQHCKAPLNSVTAASAGAAFNNSSTIVGAAQTITNAIDIYECY